MGGLNSGPSILGWGGSVDPTIASVLNLYKFPTLRGCCCSTSQGRSPKCHIICPMRGSLKQEAQRGVGPCSRSHSQSVETRTQRSVCRRYKKDREWGSPSRRAGQVRVSCLWTLSLASTPQCIQLGAQGAEWWPVLWARGPAQLHELMNLRWWEETTGSHVSGRKDMTPVHSFKI